MTPRILNKVNTYISGSKYGRFILNHKLLSENESSRSWIDFTETFCFLQKKNPQFLTNLKNISMISKMCKTISRAFNVCSFQYKLCSVLK